MEGKIFRGFWYMLGNGGVLGGYFALFLNSGSTSTWYSILYSAGILVAVLHLIAGLFVALVYLTFFMAVHRVDRMDDDETLAAYIDQGVTVKPPFGETVELLWDVATVYAVFLSLGMGWAAIWAIGCVLTVVGRLVSQDIKKYAHKVLEDKHHGD